MMSAQPILALRSGWGEVTPSAPQPHVSEAPAPSAAPFVSWYVPTSCHNACIDAGGVYTHDTRSAPSMRQGGSRMSRSDGVLATTDDGPSAPQEAASAAPMPPTLPPLA